MGQATGPYGSVSEHSFQRHRRVSESRGADGGCTWRILEWNPGDVRRCQGDGPLVGIRGLAVVVKSTDRDAAVEQYCALLESDVLEEFTIADTGLTVSVLPGLSVLSGSAEA